MVELFEYLPESIPDWANEDLENDLVEADDMFKQKEKQNLVC